MICMSISEMNLDLLISATLESLQDIKPSLSPITVSPRLRTEAGYSISPTAKRPPRAQVGISRVVSHKLDKPRSTAMYLQDTKNAKKYDDGIYSI